MSRALPERDETIEALPAATRGLLADLWARRASSELAAGQAFAAVERELIALAADPAVLALARKAVEDEPRHSELCRRLAESYGETPVPAPEPPPVELPGLEPADPELRRHLLVVAMCCINETIACAFVEACLADAEGPLVRAIHREHLSDEIDHARIGWAHLASSRVDPAVRAQVARWLPRLLEANVRHWEERIRLLPEAGVPGHALPPVAALIRAAHDAVEQVILPGFEHVGVDTAPARAWFHALPGRARS